MENRKQTSADILKFMGENLKTKSRELSFSFMANERNVLKWRIYSKLSGRKLKDVAGDAMEEYISNHPLPCVSAEIIDEMVDERLSK